MKLNRNIVTLLASQYLESAENIAVVDACAGKEISGGLNKRTHHVAACAEKKYPAKFIIERSENQ